VDVIAWVKWVSPDGAYRLDRMEFSAGRHQLCDLSSINYTATRQISKSTCAPGPWEDLIPDSTGEGLYNFLLVTLPAYVREHPQPTGTRM